MKTLNDKNFAAFLASIFRTVKSMRDKLQVAIVFAVRRYAVDGNTGCIDKIMASAVGTHGLNCRVLQAYIQEAANVQYTERADGSKGFKKANKGEAIVLNENVLAQSWYDWGVEEDVESNNAKKDWTLEGYLNAVVEELLDRHDIGAERRAEFAKKLLKTATVVKKAA